MTKFGLRWNTTKGDFFFESKDNTGNAIKKYKYLGKEEIVAECAKLAIARYRLH